MRKLAFIFARDVTKIRKTRVESRVGIHLGARSGDAMYRMRESKSKLELLPVIYRAFLSYFVINTRLNEVISFLLRVTCVIFERAIITDVWQAMVARANESKKNSREPP